MEQNLDLLKRLEAFNFDDSESSFPFSSKLAKEQQWTAEFTSRAIEEYKRFCYLAVTSGHPVSPSEVVDEVWHLHLTYSYNYWKVFCPDILQMPFHHHPSKGGKEERAKFDDWTLKTRQSYIEAFGEEPPPDIWNASKRNQKLASIDNYVIPKRLVKNLAQTAALSIGVLILVGCAESAIGNPLNMRGPDFLMFYFWFLLCLYALGWFTRKMLRLPANNSLEQIPNLSANSVAYLNGKGVLMVNAAITKLIAKGAIALDTKKVKIQVINDAFEPADELESAIFYAARQGSEVSIPTIRSRCESTMNLIKDDLVSQGLLMSPRQSLIATLSGFAIAMIGPAYGLMKINVGLERERPVMFLEILCVLSVVASLFLLITPYRTRKGDAFLESIRAQNNGLRSVGYNRQGANPEDLGFGMALFGIAALSGSSIEPQAKRLQPQAGSSSCGGGDFSTSSSSGGDGGGGDGGGGSCGGGCGGCGG